MRGDNRISMEATKVSEDAMTMLRYMAGLPTALPPDAVNAGLGWDVERAANARQELIAAGYIAPRRVRKVQG